MDTERLSEIYKLRLESKTFQEIGTRFGISRQRVHQILTRYKGTRRNLSSSQRLSLRYKEVAIQRRLEIKEQVLTYYGGGKLTCVLCEFSDVRALSIDHIASNGHQDEHGYSLYRKLVKEQFPKGYQTLCMNCQWIKRHVRRETTGPIKKRWKCTKRQENL